jgi:hypothetical protein
LVGLAKLAVGGADEGQFLVELGLLQRDADGVESD